MFPETIQCMENEPRKDGTLGSMEIDALDLIEGKMGKRAIWNSCISKFVPNLFNNNHLQEFCIF